MNFIKKMFSTALCGMSFAKLTGPLMSLSASGSIGKTLTYGAWKGINWVREHFIPANPQSTTQTNVRDAFNLSVVEWQTVLTAPQIDAYNVGAEGQGFSGFNLYMGRAMDQYIIQLGSSTDPATVAVVGSYPDDVFTWV